MQKDVLCPKCGKRLARARNGVTLEPMPRGSILLWCKGCRAEVPFEAHEPQKSQYPEPMSR
jgi:hypothetical protein